MSDVNFPPSGAPTPQQKWTRTVETMLRDLRKSMDKADNRNKNSGTSANGTLSRLQEQVKGLKNTVDTLQTTVTTLSDVVTKLTAAGQVVSAKLGRTITGFTGFYTGARPNVTVSSPTGRINVQFGGSLNSGNGILVISVVDAATGASYKSRDSMRANYDERLALSGGASFIPSAFTNVVVNVPVNTPVVVQLEFYSDSGDFVYFFGGSIQVSASL